MILHAFYDIKDLEQVLINRYIRTSEIVLHAVYQYLKYKKDIKRVGALLYSYTTLLVYKYHHVIVLMYC